MKKMLFAALVACAAGVYAQCGTPEPGPSTGTTYVYEFKANLKVVEAKAIAANNNTICEATCYRVKGTRTMKGLLIGCDDCADLFNGDSTFWLTTSASKNLFVDEADYETSGLFFGGPTAVRSTSAEMFFALEGVDTYSNGTEREFSLMCAGFGTQKAGVLRTISGNVVGMYDGALCYDGDNCSTGTEVDAIGFDPCTLEENDAAGDVTFGTWALKYNASLSKYAVTNGKELTFAKFFGSKASLPESDPA